VRDLRREFEALRAHGVTFAEPESVDYPFGVRSRHSTRTATAASSVGDAEAVVARAHSRATWRR